MAQDQIDSFSAADINTWKEAAKKELGGKDPFETLTIDKDSITIKPYYDTADTEGLPEDLLAASSDPYRGPRGWYNTPIVNVLNSVEANKIALEHLNMGADGIAFRINSEIEIDKLLSNIELAYCGTLFLIESDHLNPLADFKQYVDAKGFDKTQIVGGAFWKSPPNAKSELIRKFEAWDKFHVLGNIISPVSDPTGEIVNALLTGVNLMSEIIDEGGDPKTALAHLAFSFPIGKDFFSEIAKLKAFRKLWRQVRTAYSIMDKEDSLLIHGLSACWNNEKYEPNENMLKSTTAALSAVLGGCRFITVEPEEEDNQLKARIARNVLTLLREESHVNQTSDAAAGSYYLESLIDQMAKTAWEKFQQQVK